MRLLGTLRLASDVLNRVVIAVCILCVLTMLSISFTGFIYQFTTGEALSWTYSLARLFIPWIGMLSITVAFKSGDHVAMSAVLRALPPRLVTVIQYFNLFVVGVFAVLLIWFGWLFFESATQYYMVSDRIQVHHQYVAACVPVTGLVLLFHLVSGLSLFEPLDAAPEIQ